MNILKIIMQAYAKLPSWARVSTWFVLLALVVYLYVSPRFVNGQAVVALDNGGTIEYRGATLRTQVEGRVLKFQTNEDGYWSVPVVSRLPFHPIHMQVYHEDARAWYDVDIDAKTVWKAGMGSQEIRLLVKDDPPSVAQTIIAKSGGGEGIFGAVLNALAGNAAYAQQNPAGRQLSKAEITRAVGGIIARETGKEPSTVKNSYRLNGKGGPTYVEKIRIVDQVERKFGIRVPDEEWRAMATAGDLVEFVRQKQKR